MQSAVIEDLGIVYRIRTGKGGEPPLVVEQVRRTVLSPIAEDYCPTMLKETQIYINAEYQKLKSQNPENMALAAAQLMTEFTGTKLLGYQDGPHLPYVQVGLAREEAITDPEEFKRQLLIRQILDAYTPEEAIAARNAIQAWIRVHPKDFNVLQAGEQLAIANGW